MKNKVLNSYAFLKANFDARRKNYLDNFTAFVVECIRTRNLNPITIPSIHSALIEDFNIDLPKNTIKILLNKLYKSGHLRIDDEIITQIEEKINDNKFYSIKDDILRKFENTISRLQKYSTEKYNRKWTTEKTEEALLEYLNINDYRILLSSQNKESNEVRNTTKENNNYIVGCFIKYMYETSEPGFDDLLNVAQGHILANAIFLDSITTRKKFHETEVYLDTSIIIFALGYAGFERKQPARELISVLLKDGAKIGCFTHTKDEIKGILNACAYRIRMNDIHDSYGPSLDYFIKQGCRESDIIEYIASLDVDISKLKITIKDRPSFDEHKHVIDEQSLDKMLTMCVKYRNPEAKQRDIDSLSSIARLRHGEIYSQIEVCKAIFVTSNSGLAKCAKMFFSEDELEYNVIPPCVTDTLVFDLLWLKQPLNTPDIPRKKLIASCFAATQPSERLWQIYIEIVEKHEDDGKLTQEKYYYLRYATESRELLMELTEGNEAIINNETVDEVLRRIEKKREEEHEKITKNATEKVDEAITGRLKAENEREEILQQKEEMVEGIKLFCREWAKNCIYIFKSMLTCILLVPIILVNINIRDNETKWAISIALTLLNIITVWGIVSKVTIPKIFDKIEESIYFMLWNYMRKKIR